MLACLDQLIQIFLGPRSQHVLVRVRGHPNINGILVLVLGGEGVHLLLGVEHEYFSLVQLQLPRRGVHPVGLEGRQPVYPRSPVGEPQAVGLPAVALLDLETFVSPIMKRVVLGFLGVQVNEVPRFYHLSQGVHLIQRESSLRPQRASSQLGPVLFPAGRGALQYVLVGQGHHLDDS